MTSRQSYALVLDIDGVIRDVSQSYRRALADTAEFFSGRRPTMAEIDRLKQEGLWNNDWEASQELIRRFAPHVQVEYAQVVAFFQSRYRGQNWDGYIQQEPLLVEREFFQRLEAAGIPWGFFSGATRASAMFVLKRLGLTAPLLVAMEDAPGKPDPTGLIQIAHQLDRPHVLYVGDTVADMLTVGRAREQDKSHTYEAIGVIPPHVTAEADYAAALSQGGADRICRRLRDLTF
ncbi:MAG: TIGR01548 family HAD-type hydrolase [Pseudanabaenaceae cyanobacterium]